jgi:hypothetical protein
MNNSFTITFKLTTHSILCLRSNHMPGSDTKVFRMNNVLQPLMAGNGGETKTKTMFQSFQNTRI